jgi:hypothetical protein
LFLTRFSYLNPYFLFLVFSHNCYLPAFSRLSWLRGNPISHPVFSYLFYSNVLHCTCTPIFVAHIMHFLEARGLREPATDISTGFLSPFCLFPKVSHANVHWANAKHTFFSHNISTGELRLIVACLTTASGQFPKCSLHLIALQWVPCTSLNAIVWTFLATKSFPAGSSTDPCHLACVSISPEGHHIFDWL